MTGPNATDSLTNSARTVATAWSSEIALTVLVAGLAIALGVPYLVGDALPGADTAWGILGGLVAAVGLASYDYQREHAANDERQLLIRYRATHVAFAGLLGLLSVYVILISGDRAILDPKTALRIALGFGLLAYFAGEAYYRRTL